MIFTSNMGHVAVSIPGVSLDSTSWDKFDGADHSSSTSIHNPGGMQPAVPVAGVTKREPATIERAWDDTLIGLYMALDASVNNPIGVSLTPLTNPTTAASGKPGGFNYTGIINKVSRPGYDASSSSVAKLVISCELAETMS